jgi:hypothetical protein
MARKTYGSIVTINSTDPDFPKEWGQHEWVRARTLKKQGDTEWINRQGTNSILDQDAKDGVSVSLEGDIVVTATVARMVLAWGLTRDQLDGSGNPLDKGDGRFVQEPIEWPDGQSEAVLEKRLDILREMHELDVLYIFNRIMAQTPISPLKTEEQQKNSSPSADAPSSES